MQEIPLLLETHSQALQAAPLPPLVFPSLPLVAALSLLPGTHLQEEVLLCLACKCQ